MKSILNLFLALITVIATAALAGQAGLPMPPSFTDEGEPETVLRVYRSVSATTVKPSVL